MIATTTSSQIQISLKKMYLLAVVTGGGCGALVRFIIANHFNNTSFPLGTLIANAIAALLVGILYVLIVEYYKLPIAKSLYLILGALSTLSALSLETLFIMFENGKGRRLLSTHQRHSYCIHFCISIYATRYLIGFI